MSQMDTIGNQMRSALRNQASGAVSKVKSRTGLVGQAARFTGAVSRKSEEVLSGKHKPGKISGTVSPASAPHPAPDGYVRRSPVQPVRESEDYRKKQVKKAVGIALLCVCAVAGAWLLLQTNLLAF